MLDILLKRYKERGKKANKFCALIIDYIDAEFKEQKFIAIKGLSLQETITLNWKQYFSIVTLIDSNIQMRASDDTRERITVPGIVKGISSGLKHCAIVLEDARVMVRGSNK